MVDEGDHGKAKDMALPASLNPLDNVLEEQRRGRLFCVMSFVTYLDHSTQAHSKLIHRRTLSALTGQVSSLQSHGILFAPRRGSLRPCGWYAWSLSISLIDHVYLDFAQLSNHILVRTKVLVDETIRIPLVGFCKLLFMYAELCCWGAIQ